MSLSTRGLGSSAGLVVYGLGPITGYIVVINDRIHIVEAAEYDQIIAGSLFQHIVTDSDRLVAIANYLGYTQKVEFESYRVIVPEEDTTYLIGYESTTEIVEG